ncbi:MAG: hypothetical protein K2J67_01180 [Lachnospiraceae bacterium]|nr:hypothetical protein [Lachnospiraceae bacterium]
MRRIEENRSAWDSARAAHTTGKRRTAAYAARYAANRYSKTKGTNNTAGKNLPNQKGMDPRSYTSPEYQSAISSRRYEVASWLRDMGTVEDADTAGSAGEAVSGSGNQGPAYNWKPVSDGTDVVFDQEPEEVDELEELEKEMEKTSQEQEEQKAEKDLERLKKMLDSLRQKKADATKSKKRLNYRYQQVSTAIRGAKTVMQASNALTKATSGLTQVKRQASSGKYSDREISIAATHARKMVRTARKKLRNLKAETWKKNDGVRVKNDTGQKMGIVVKRTDAKKKLEVQLEKDRQLQKLTKEIQVAENKYKNRHRRKENWELMEADMEYLRRKIAYLKNEEEEQKSEYQLETSMDTQNPAGEIGPDGTNVFTSEEQSVILEQEAVVVQATVKENMS